tara:strand:+ start:422 stop:2359 length:1938 start_codon:yes stop_codon:yes gene_type:complete
MAENLELNLNIKGGAKATKTIGDLEKQLEKAREEIKGVEVGSAAFDKLATQIQKASSEVKTLEKQMEGLEPQQKAEAFLKMGEGIAGGFMAAQGAMGLLGIESEELEKIQVKVQSAIAIAMGIRMMAEAALMAKTASRVAAEKLSIVTTKANILVTKLAAGAQALLSKSVGVTTISLKALKAAIISTGIGALIVGIGSLISSLMSATSATSGLNDEMEVARHRADSEAEAIAKKVRNLDREFQLKQDLKNANSDQEKQLITNKKRLEELNSVIQQNSDFYSQNEKELNKINTAIRNSEYRIDKWSNTIKGNLWGSGIWQQIQEESEILEHLNKRQKNFTDTMNKQKEVIDASMKSKTKLMTANVELDKTVNKLKKTRTDANSKAKQEAKDRARRLEDHKAEILSLEQEIELLGIQNDDDRAKRKLEIDLANELADVERSEKSEELKSQIKEKYRILEEQRQEEWWDNFIVKNNEFNQKRIDEDEEAKNKQKDIEDELKQFKLDAIQSGFDGAEALFENNKKVGKAFAAARVIYNTQQGITEALAATSIQDKLMPFWMRFINAAAVGTMGIASLRNIMSDNMGKVPNPRGDSGASAAASSVRSMVPSTADAFSLQQADEPIRAYVVTDEVTDSQDQLANIRRRATI